MWTRNIVVFIALIMAILALDFLSRSLRPFEHFGVPLESSTEVIAYAFVIIGIGSFFVLGGGFWTRTILATLAPLSAFLLLELAAVISGSSDDGYRWLRVITTMLFAGASFLGCVFVGGPIFLWLQHRRRRHLTHQSRADAQTRAADF